MLVKSQNSYSYPTPTYSCELCSLFSLFILFFSVPLILVSTGSPTQSVSSTKTEIINIDNNGLTCKDLEEYPLQIDGAVGFNMGSLPVICGGIVNAGIIPVIQCYRMESGKWQPFVNLTQKYVFITGLSQGLKLYQICSNPSDT